VDLGPTAWNIAGRTSRVQQPNLHTAALEPAACKRATCVTDRSADRAFHLVLVHRAIWPSDHESGMTSRIPGHPVRDCARSCNRWVSRRFKVSAIDVTAKTFFERLFFLHISPPQPGLFLSVRPEFLERASSIKFSRNLGPKKLCSHYSTASVRSRRLSARKGMINYECWQKNCSRFLFTLKFEKSHVTVVSWFRWGFRFAFWSQFRSTGLPRSRSFDIRLCGCGSPNLNKFEEQW